MKLGAPSVPHGDKTTGAEVPRVSPKGENRRVLRLLDFLLPAGPAPSLDTPQGARQHPLRAAVLACTCHVVLGGPVARGHRAELWSSTERL